MDKVRWRLSDPHLTLEEDDVWHLAVLIDDDAKLDQSFALKEGELVARVANIERGRVSVVMLQNT